ncbi:MAG: hypothetical protein B7Z39_01890 [Novosphingobium sp. 12-64-8]|nr:MAG: hypothetical protein B7Z39_01890 [Novosphingobium sp. 12-64-8]
MQIDFNGHSLDFFDCMEVGQGGPNACFLSINGQKLADHKFDPSPLMFEDHILVSMRKITFLKSGYVLARIDPETCKVEIISKVHEYMKLRKVQGRSVEFSTSSWGDGVALCPIP